MAPAQGQSETVERSLPTPQREGGTERTAGKPVAEGKRQALVRRSSEATENSRNSSAVTRVVAAEGAEAEAAPQAGADDASTGDQGGDAPKSVVVIMRFGDGSERHYTGLAWQEGLTALEALQRAAAHPRGVPLQVRGRGKTAFVVSIDGLANEGDSGKNWIFRVNGKVGEQSAGVVEVPAGGRVEWNFETPP